MNDVIMNVYQWLVWCCDVLCS